MSDTTERAAVAAEAYRRQPDGKDPKAVRAYWRDVTLGEEQADRLGWSAGHAAAVELAAAGALLLDREGVPRHVTGPGPGRRVAAGRIAALCTAGYLTGSEPDAAGRRRIQATADGRRALAVWQLWTPDPVAMDKRGEADALAPLHQGDEARRRAVAAARSLRESERRREAEWRTLQEQITADRREEALNRRWREATGVRNPFARRPAGWTPETQAEADRAAELEAAEAAAREAAHVCETRELPAVAVDERTIRPAAAADAPAPYRYRYAVEGPQRADRYTGPLARVEGRMRIHDGTARLTVRTHDAGRHGTLRRDAVELMAHGYGVRTCRLPRDPVTGRAPRHALAVEGDPLEVARFAADLPALLAAVEAAATTGVRELARWRTGTGAGQRWSQQHTPAQWRSRRRHWRRICIQHVARWVGPLYDGSRPEPGMPDEAQDWTQHAPRVAQELAHTVDAEALRDHMAEALLFAQAVLADEADQLAAEPTRTSSTRAPSARRTPLHRPLDRPRISRRARPYGSISTRTRRRRTAPTTPPSRPHTRTPALEKETRA
ncbi:hypothetical protein [Streptomyces sp. IB2014 011-1]|uniref:hypothetical protein n=1 Tax=Streptomyces sp. IB2014 011-1 TaxID=1844478 RepID=UPI000978D81A|nr:hypothetical protein [Streptomyces sp. IB2014 011-1]ONI48519.1 hypothetical protein STIB_73440 [Streptomyces sp. IB2014 011-1]